MPTRRMSFGSSPGPDSFALARVVDHTQREERLAKVRLSRWANDLQKSLAAERERYERLAKGERAIWLTERLGECVADGQLVAVRGVGRKGEGVMVMEECDGGLDMSDPFGLLAVNESVGRRVLVMIKIAGLEVAGAKILGWGRRWWVRGAVERVARVLGL